MIPQAIWDLRDRLVQYRVEALLAAVKSRRMRGMEEVDSTALIRHNFSALIELHVNPRSEMPMSGVFGFALDQPLNQDPLAFSYTSSAALGFR